MMHHRHRIHVPLHRRIFLMFTLTIAATKSRSALLLGSMLATRRNRPSAVTTAAIISMTQIFDCARHQQIILAGLDAPSQAKSSL